MFLFRVGKKKAPTLVAVSDNVTAAEVCIREDETGKLLESSKPLVCTQVWRRAVACIIDECLLALVLNIFPLVVLYAVMGSVRLGQIHIFSRTAGPEYTLAVCGAFVLLAMLNFVGSIVVRFCYYALFESSDAQATPGKRWLGLKVMNDRGQRMSFKASIAKGVVQSVLAYLCLLPAGLCIFFQSQAVVPAAWAGILVYCLLGYGVIALNSGRQTVFDKITRRFVVHERASDVFGAKSDKRSGRIIMFERAFVAGAGVGLMLYAGSIPLNLSHGGVEVLGDMKNPNFSGTCLRAKKDLHVGDRLQKGDFEVLSLGRLCTPISTESSLNNVEGGVVAEATDEGDFLLVTNYLKHPVPVTTVTQRELTPDELFQIRMHKWQRAEKELDKGDSSGRPRASFLVDRAWIYNQHGEFSKALADCNQALRLLKDPETDTMDEAYVTRAVAYSGLKETRKAMDDLKKVESLVDDDRYQTALAQIDHQTGKVPEAAMHFARARQLAQSAESRRLCSAAQTVRDGTAGVDTDEQRNLLAIEVYTLAIKTDPTNSSAYTGRAKCQLDLHKIKEALADANLAIKNGANDPEPYKTRSLVYQAMKQDYLAGQDDATAFTLEGASADDSD